MFGELRSILLAIKERRGEWQKVSPAITVPVSDGISLLEKYYDCILDNDIYYSPRRSLIARSIERSSPNIRAAI
jgi:hypothetical protein